MLATEAGIDDGLELARSLDTVYDVTFSRECFCDPADLTKEKLEKYLKIARVL